MRTDQLAQISEETLPTIFPPARFFTINSFTNMIIPILLTGAGLVFLIMLFLGSFKIITAGGDPENMANAKKLFSYAILGFVVVALSYFFVKVIGLILNVDVFI